MAADRFGNSLKTARRLNSTGTNLFSGKDAIGGFDRDDLSRFSVSQRASFELKLFTPIGTKKQNLGTVGVDVFSLKALSGKALRALTRTRFSELKLKTLKAGVTFLKRSRFKGGNQSITLTLDPGEYFFRIHGGQKARAYRVTTTLTPTDTTTPTDSTNPPTPTAPTLKFNRSWVRQFGTAANDYLYGLTVSQDGTKLFVSGSTEGGLTNPAGGTATNQGDRDSFAAQFSTTGDPLWVRQFGSTGLDVAYDIASDGLDNYYTVGVRVDPASMPANPNGYLAKFNSSGVEQGTRTTLNTQVSIPFPPGAVNAADALSGIAIDASGDLIAGGLIKGFPSISASKAVVIKYNGTTRAESWRRELDLPQSSGISGLVLDENGNIYVTGLTNATLTTDVNNPLTGSDVFIAKLDANGNPLWTQTLATPAQDESRGIAIDQQGNVYVTGSTQGSLPNQNNAGSTDGFLVKYDTNGTLQWLKQFGSTGLDESQAIAVDSSGKIYVTGETTGTLFGNAPLGQSDAWLATYDSAGNLLASTVIGTASNEETYNITVSANKIYLVGQTQGNLAGTGNQGSYDAWVAEYTLDPVSA